MLAQSDKENTRRAKVTMPSEREIVIERVFDAARTVVSKPGRRPSTLRTGGTQAACRLPFVKSTFGQPAHFDS